MQKSREFRGHEKLFGADGGCATLALHVWASRLCGQPPLEVGLIIRLGNLLPVTDRQRGIEGDFRKDMELFTIVNSP